ncbi:MULTISPECIES: hypothetical protein [unclassified Paenibacillus]|uniref:hypothetical protein n=1 Tax=unclassified Paenibacillus TaxID=185978 RepID=UPI00020D762B|nr:MULTISPECIES: hypothetical protein [unclassified Paenibacillus]EGL15060.1 hypothetical protein HMPREF9413_5738 [Paenibacillus sp. HGF7]EPD80464.1 hypothetical protein HMPREF1207_05679 [Paenibacillus sp. HGH0039]
MKKGITYLMILIGLIITGFFVYVMLQTGFSVVSLIGAIVGLVLILLQVKKLKDSSEEDEDEDEEDEDDF